MLIAIAIIGINHLLVTIPGQFLPVWVSNINYENTIFGRLNKIGLSSSIFSSSLPYCSAYLSSLKYIECKGSKFNYINVLK